MVWYNASWTYRVTITVASAEVNATLTDFPVYVDLSDLPAGFHTNVDTAGDDIRVTQSDGETEVPFEIVFITPGSSIGELHFKANSLSSTVDTVFYIYYGNGDASAYAVGDTYGRNNVWTGFDQVFHLEETSGTAMVDATGNNNGTGASGWAATATGQLSGGGQDADSGHMTIVENQWAVSTSRTNTSWLKNDAMTSLSGWLDTRGTDGYVFNYIDGENNRWRNAARSSGDYNSVYYNNTDTGTYKLHQQVINIGDTDHVYWVNGAYADNNAMGGNLTTENAQTNKYADWSSTSFDGDCDEFRVYSGVESDEWMVAEHTNQSATTTFYAVGAEEEDTPATGPTITNFISIQGIVSIQA